MSTFIVNYINPIGIENIGWRYYVITTVFILLVLVVIYFTFVETKGLSLEEVATRTSTLSRSLSPSDPETVTDKKITE